MKVCVAWAELHQNRNRLWSANYCLYSYLHPERDQILYIGKAGGSSVRQRMSGEHKRRLFEDFEKDYGIAQIRVYVGVLTLEQGRKRTSELLADVESLLIKRLKPYGNISARKSRISRPGLRVRCIGEWPYKRASFQDL